MITWRGPEFVYYPKSAGWYLANFAALALLALFALWQKNFLLIVFLSVAEILMIVWANRRPPEIVFEISERGVKIGDDAPIPYKNIDNFTIKSDGASGELVMPQKKALKPTLRIPLPEESVASQVKEFLLRFLPETEAEDSFIDSLAKLIGF